MNVSLLLIAVFSSEPEPAIAVGASVVLIQPVDMTTITGSKLPMTPGTTMTVREVEGDRLKVAAGRVGWVASSAVIPAGRADQFFTDAIQKDSQSASAWLARGKVRFEKAGLDEKKIREAFVDLDQSLTLKPSSEALTLRGYGWKRMGDKQKAIKDFDAAIQLNPREALAWRIRGATFASLADYERALANYSESIRIDPENPDSRHHRAVLQSACMDERFRNGRQAVEDATKACEVSEWKTPLYLTGLAFACAESGDFDAATTWQTKAIELSDSKPGSMQTNLELFRQQKPFRMTWK